LGGLEEKMSSAARWQVRSVAFSLALFACAIPGTCGAQEFQLIRAQCEIYSLKQAVGLPPVEVHRISPEFFSVFADSDASTIWGYNPGYYNASTGGMQRTEVFADSIYFHERVDIQATGTVQSAINKSDGLLLFRVAAGQNLKYYFGGTLWVANPGHMGTVASASVSLSRVEPGGTTVLATKSIQTDPNMPSGPTEVWWTVGFNGLLTPGDYLYEAHLYAEVPPWGGDPWGELWLRFAVHNVPTAVEPLSWGAVKSLFR
jgi:hypothetical protein